MSVIKAKLREQKEKFISLRETLERMAKDGDGCDLRQAATFLYQLLIRRKAPSWQTIFYGEISEADNSCTFPLLDAIIKNGKFEFSFDDFYSLSDCNQYGFLISEITEFLLAEDVDISECPDNIPAWVHSLRRRKHFGLEEAASVLNEFDPGIRLLLNDNSQLKISNTFNTLEQAAKSGNLPVVSVDNFGNPLFRAQDLRAWAASVGLDWCIPFDAPAVAVTPAGAADEAIRHRLRQLEAKNAQFVDQVEGCEAREHLEAENARLVEQVAELRRQLQEATATPQQAPQEAGPAPQQATAAPQNDDEKPWSKAERKTFVNIVGAMLDLLVPHVRTSEALLIETLEDVYGNRGLKSRTLQNKFAEAKRSIKLG